MPGSIGPIYRPCDIMCSWPVPSPPSQARTTHIASWVPTDFANGIGIIQVTPTLPKVERPLPEEVSTGSSSAGR